MDVAQLFWTENIFEYAPLTPANSLKHSYEAGVDFGEIVELLSNLRADIEEWYFSKNGRAMDTYNLGADLHEVLDRFWRDSRFSKALKILKLPGEKEDISIPWWNQVAAGELGYEGLEVRLGPRHSYQTQMIRQGHSLPIKSVSVGGLILSSDGHIMIGLRSGNSFPNTYHIPAGALEVTDGLKRGMQTIYDIFRATELEPETGITEDEIEEATVHSRIMDYSMEQGPTYCFKVQTKLNSRELRQKWETNGLTDKKEHQDVTLIPLNGINDFIMSHYVGICENRMGRNDSRRFLLHPGALSLASLSEMPISRLRDFYKEGLH